MDPAGPVEHAVALLERTGGCAAVDDLAREAGLSARQFRRVCLERTGFTPKFLARVLRFRRAAARLASGRAAADLALDCGYYDQAHLIHDFREFSGRTPRSAETALSRG
jgi:methylphosphotriester-DNA--protein-cysteine methyltransferase